MEKVVEQDKIKLKYDGERMKEAREQKEKFSPLMYYCCVKPGVI